MKRWRKAKGVITRERCSNWKRYKAFKEPKCGCNACWTKYWKVESDRRVDEWFKAKAKVLSDWS